VDKAGKLNAENVRTLSEELMVRTRSLASQAATHAKLIDNLQAASYVVYIEDVIKQKVAGLTKEIYMQVERVETESEARETRQALRDQNNVKSMQDLRNSTQKAFDQVRNDVEQLLKLSQKLNERIGMLESGTAAALKAAQAPAVAPTSIDQMVFKHFDERLEALENPKVQQTYRVVVERSK
jgi:4-diphosphocytidyl-2C-methyl-D-erythritol kinase